MSNEFLAKLFGTAVVLLLTQQQKLKNFSIYKQLKLAIYSGNPGNPHLLGSTRGQLLMLAWTIARRGKIWQLNRTAN